MRLLKNTLCGLLLLVLGTGCTRTVTVGQPTGEADSGRKWETTVHSLRIPPGHLPPPGSCRIWVPGVPPGRQSAPGDCASLASRVPPGAWLVTRTRKQPRYVEVDIYHRERIGVVVGVELYVAATGEFVERRSAR